ncbi:MAG: single-stranded-DNA-specific exonuclease RecJ [Deltaproteobacteria bacterium]|jgi:single-stranded-DNA-specific exonuclease|nr:single-stranded-DNA-specific exonuclease RecJ [Deltaproteobacteria bacterium]
MMKWKYRLRDAELAKTIAYELDKPLQFGQFLVGRDFKKAEEVRDFINLSLKSLPDPISMPGMKKAVDLLMEARKSQALVAISGDYDADGLTATALLKRVLGALGFNVMTRIPHRLDEGYGFSAEAVRELHAAGASYVITVDSGVSDIDAVLVADVLGMKVVITDHHELPPTLPEAAAIINPHLGGGWENTELAGVGVAFMLAWALKNQVNDPELKLNFVEHLALVALGTIADLVPLKGHNRVLAQQGLKFLMASDWPGLYALRRILNLDAQPRISAKDVGFKLAPRLNAAGRLGSAKPALDLLLTDSRDEAIKLVDQLEAINKLRFETQARLLTEALEMLEHDCLPSDRTVVLAKEGWPKGLLGLVASKVAEKTGKPAIMLSIDGDLAAGSGRTVGCFNLFKALSKVRDLFVSMGGHSQAAGLKLEVKNLQEFKIGFEQASWDQNWDWGHGELTVDLVTKISELSVLAPHFAELEPFGQGNPSPMVMIKDLNVLRSLVLKGNRLDLRLSDGLQRLNVFGFNLASRYSEVTKQIDVVLVYEPDLSLNGSTWRLIDFRTSKEVDPYKKPLPL